MCVCEPFKCTFLSRDRGAVFSARKGLCPNKPEALVGQADGACIIQREACHPRMPTWLDPRLSLWPGEKLGDLDHPVAGGEALTDKACLTFCLGAPSQKEGLSDEVFDNGKHIIPQKQ